MGESVAFATDVAAMLAMTGVWVVAVWEAGGGGQADWNGARVVAVWVGAAKLAMTGCGWAVAVCAAVCSLE